jgi:hypothetical protein
LLSAGQCHDAGSHTGAIKDRKGDPSILLGASGVIAFLEEGALWRASIISSWRQSLGEEPGYASERGCSSQVFAAYLRRYEDLS